MTSISSTSDERIGILVLDLGTSGLRTSLYDLTGRRVEGHGNRYSWTLVTTSDGGAELDPDTVFNVVVQGIDEILTECDSSKWSIAHIASCVLCPTVVGLDRENRPVTPAYTWADVRAADAAAGLKTILNPEDVFQRTGCVLHAAYLPAKLRWISQRNSSLFKQVVRWCGLGDYITLRLYGRLLTSLSVASWTGLTNRHSMTWDQPLLSAIAISDDRLPEINVDGEPITQMTGDWSTRWPALAQASWHLPIGDGVANNVGSGCLSPDRVALMMATSGALRIITDDQVERIPAGLWAYRIDKQRTLLGGALSSGGNVLDWLLESLQIDIETFPRVMSQQQPDAHGLTVLPFLAGERNPNWADHARGAIIGLSLKTSPVDILQATVESIIYQYSLIYDALKPFLPADHRVIASGGAISHHVYLAEIVADVFDHRIFAYLDFEMSSTGVAVFTLQNLGLIDDIGHTLPTAALVADPTPANHQLYQAGKERHIRLYDKLIRT